MLSERIFSIGRLSIYHTRQYTIAEPSPEMRSDADVESVLPEWSLSIFRGKSLAFCNGDIDSYSNMTIVRDNGLPFVMIPTNEYSDRFVHELCHFAEADLESLLKVNWGMGSQSGSKVFYFEESQRAEVEKRTPAYTAMVRELQTFAFQKNLHSAFDVTFDESENINFLEHFAHNRRFLDEHDYSSMSVCLADYASKPEYSVESFYQACDEHNAYLARIYSERVYSEELIAC